MEIPEKLLNLYGGAIQENGPTKISWKTIIIVVVVVSIGVGENCLTPCFFACRPRY